MRVAYFGTWSAYSHCHVEAAASAADVVGVVEAGKLAARVHRKPDLFEGPLAPLRRRLLSASPWVWARQRGLPALWWRKEEIESITSALRSWAPDLGVVASFPSLFPPELLAVPRLGFINVHASLLPQFPGPQPILWQYLTGISEGGITVHRIGAGEDDGNILAQEAIFIPLGFPPSEYQRKLTEIGPRLLAQVVRGLAEGSLAGRPQPSLPGRIRARRVNPGEPLVDWDGPLERAAHALLAILPLHGHPGLDPKYAWSVIGSELRPAQGPAGTLAMDERGYFLNHPGGRIRLERHRPWKARLKARLVEVLL